MIPPQGATAAFPLSLSAMSNKNFLVISDISQENDSRGLFLTLYTKFAIYILFIVA